MANPNQQLEAALAQFANQPGITPDQAAQLRAAITGNAQQLQELNQQAQAGQLRGFALQLAANPAPNLAGTYDIQSGIVTLPGSSFQPAGTMASPDLMAAVKMQQMSIEFGHKTYLDAANSPHSVTQGMVDNLQSTINQSPVLAEQIKKAATTIDGGDRYRRTHLEHFDLIAPGFAAGGTYNGDDKTMRLPPHDLQTKTTANPQGHFDADDMTFVLGHEIQHGFNHRDKQQAFRTFYTDSVAIAKSAQAIHDYTVPVSNYIQAGRVDEAKAEIGGWNALLSRQKQIQPLAQELDLMLRTLSDRVKDFVDQDPAVTNLKARPLPGLAFNQDGTLSMSPGNIAAMGQHYFNKPDHAHAQSWQRSLGIGEKGTSDYPNYYGAFAVEMVAGVERRYANQVNGVMPQMTINMASARISEELLEKEGINLGINKTPQPYYDSSQTPAALHHFDHTQDRSVSPTQDHQYVPVAPSAPSQRRSPEDPDHPENALLEKMRAGVRDLDRQVDKPWDEQSERLSASALAMAVEKEFRPGDDLWIGLNQKTERYAAGELLLVQRVGGNVSADTFQNRAHMPTVEALSQPAEQRYQQVEVMRQTQIEEQQRQRQEALTRSQNPPSQGGPSMSM